MTKVSYLKLFLFAIMVVLLAGPSYANGLNVCIDNDSDGWGIGKLNRCAHTDKLDCDDNDAKINPGAKEICDLKDNNCDGVVDESFNVWKACSVGIGACKKDGIIACSPDGKSSFCSAVAASPQPEVCGDAIDNDCDGVVDNGCVKPIGDIVIKRTFKGSLDAATQLQFVATRYKEAIFVESGQSKPTNLKATNPAIKVLKYSKTAGSHSPETRAPNGDFFWSIASTHRWATPSGGFAKQTQFGWYFIDLRDIAFYPSWAQKQMDWLSADTAPYDGWFLDSAGAIDPSLIAEYPVGYTDDSYDTQTVNLLSAIRQKAGTKHILINGYQGRRPADFRGLAYYPSANGIMFEGFARKVGMKYYDAVRYEQQLNDFCTAASQGREPVATDYISSTEESNSAVRTFIFASYLLAASPTSYIYTIGSSDVQLFPEDDIALGAPTSECFTKQGKVFRRDFTSGVRVFVNMSGATQSVTLSGTIEKLQIQGNTLWNGAGSVSWVPQTSAIIMNDQEALILRVK